jgi:hypothetical protein
MRRRFAGFALLSAGCMSVAFACGTESPIVFVGRDAQPSPEDAVAEPETDTGSGGAETSVDAVADQSSEDAPFDGSGADGRLDDGSLDGGSVFDGDLLDGADPDALISKDAGERVDASGCGECDCDHDSFNRAGCGDNEAGVDCDDEDTRYRPNQNFIDIKPDPGKLGNWSCKPDASFEKLYPHGVTCNLLSVTGCTGAQGFSGDPGCGESGAYVHCVAPLGILLCTVASTETRTQACR